MMKMTTILKSEVIELTWDQAKAQALFDEYKSFWSRSKEFGISGNPDAGSGQRNSRNVYMTVLNHGNGQLNRKQRSKDAIDVDPTFGTFLGAGDVLTELEELVAREVIDSDTEEELQYYLEVMEKINSDTSVGPKARNPRNISFRGIVAYADGEAERDVVYGHFLTPAYWQYRTDKAKKQEQRYDMPKPDKEWSSSQANKAKPPLWQAMFDPKNGLVKLIQEVLEIVQKTLRPTPDAHLVTLNQRKTGDAARLSGIKPLLEKVLNDPSIYAGGSSKEKGPRKGRFLTAVENEILQVNESDLRILGPICRVLVLENEETVRMKLEDVPNYEEIKAVNLKFPSTITLNKLVREVMGEEFMNTFRRPGLPEDVSSGLVLKTEASLIQQATTLLKSIMDLKKGRKRFFAGINIPKWIGDLAPPGQQTRNVNVSKDIILSYHAVVRLQGLDDQPQAGRDIEIAWYVEDAIKIIQQKINDGSYPKMPGRQVDAYQAYFIVIGDGRLLGTIGVFSPEHDENYTDKYLINYITPGDKSRRYDRFSENIRPTRTTGPAWKPAADERQMHTEETWTAYLRAALSRLPSDFIEGAARESFNSSIGASFRTLASFQNRVISAANDPARGLEASKIIERVVANPQDYTRNHRDRADRLERVEAREQQPAPQPRRRRRQTSTSTLGRKTLPKRRERDKSRRGKPAPTARRGERRRGETTKGGLIASIVGLAKEVGIKEEVIDMLRNKYLKPAANVNDVVENTYKMLAEIKNTRGVRYTTNQKLEFEMGIFSLFRERGLR